MKLYFGHKIDDLIRVRYFLLIFLALASFVMPGLVRAQSDSSGYQPQPLIGNKTPLQLIEAQRNAIRHSQASWAGDFLPTVSDPNLAKAVAGNVSRVAEDAPVPSTASQVTSPEQTEDITLNAWSLSATTGIPTNSTAQCTDVEWSHGGSILIFSSNAGGLWHLYVMLANGAPFNQNGGNPVYVEQVTGLPNTPTANLNQRYPSLLGPDDNFIAYCQAPNTLDASYELVEAPFIENTAEYSVNESDITVIDATHNCKHPFYVGDSIYYAAASASGGVNDIYVATSVGSSVSISQITSGVADNDNPNVNSANQLAWDSTASTATSWSYNPYAGTPLTSTAASTVRNIYASLTSGGGLKEMTQPGSSTISWSNEHPQWTIGTTNAFTTAGTYDLFFDSNRPPMFGPYNSTVPTSHIYYYTASNGNTLQGETTTTGETSTAVQVNTSDPSGFAATYTSTSTPIGNQFSDYYPSVSPLNNNYIGVAYISNRYLLGHNYDNPLIQSILHQQSTTTASNTANAINNESTFGNTTTLTSAINSGVTTLPVSDNANFVPDQTIYIDQNTSYFESAIISSVSSSGPPTITLKTPTTNDHQAYAVINDANIPLALTSAAGTQPISLKTIAGLNVGMTVEFDRGLGADEFAIITAINSNANPPTITTTALQNQHVENSYMWATVDEEPSSIPVNTPGASEVFVSRLVDVNPPSLVRFNDTSEEVIHVFPGGIYTNTGALNYNPESLPTHYIPSGQKMTMVVRLSDRQTGVGQVWAQIKDPNSFTQDSTGLEHKVFTQQLSTQLHPAYNEATTIGTQDFTNGGFYYESGLAGNNGDHIVIGNQAIQPIGAVTTLSAGATVGSTALTVTSSSGVSDGPIVVGTSALGAQVYTVTSVNNATNTLTIAAPGTTQAYSSGTTVSVARSGGAFSAAAAEATPGVQYFTLPFIGYLGEIVGLDVGGTILIGGEVVVPTAPQGTTCVVCSTMADPNYDNYYSTGFTASYPTATPVVILGQATFDPMGSEIDCQAINTSLPANDSNGNDQISSLASSYTIPEYTPGYDDAGTSFDSQVAYYTSKNGENDNPPSYWLQLQPLPANLQDNNGGVLYYGTWTTPATGSDYYIDIIAEDGSNQSGYFDSETPPGSTLTDLSNNQAENWQIYDNVWGFYTLPFQTKHKILVVNDYALPQKFFSRPEGPATTFGAESYWTDISNDVIGWQTAYATPPTTAAAMSLPTMAIPLMGEDVNLINGPLYYAMIDWGIDQAGGGSTFTNYFPEYMNGLGVNSYNDAYMNPSTVTTFDPSGDTSPTKLEQTPLPASQQYDIWRILSRGPVPSSILAGYGGAMVSQPSDPSTGDSISHDVAPSMVVWLSPYSGDTFVGPGTITDVTNAQQPLEAFLAGGGRLHIEGKNIGYALTDDGQVPNAFYDTYLCDDYSGSALITDDVGNADAAYVLTPATTPSDLISFDAWPNQTHPNYIYPTSDVGNYDFTSPASKPLIVSHFADSDTYDATERSDGSMNTNGIYTYSFIDGFSTGTGGTGGNLAPHTELFGTTDKEIFYSNSTTGAMVSYSSFGIGSISQDVENAPAGPVQLFVVTDQRSMLIHNIVCALRTGAFIGTVTSSASGEQPISGAVVEAFPTGVTNPPLYSAKTNGAGAYEIDGVPAGNYELQAYAQAYNYQHVISATNNVHGGDSRTVDISLTPAPNGDVTVLVENSGGVPISGATVTLSEVTGASSPSPAVTGANGIATFNNVLAGKYTVGVTAFGYGAYTNTTLIYNVAGGGTMAIGPIILGAGSTSITGTVTISGTTSAAPIVGATVTLTTLTGTPIAVLGATFTATTASDGSYTLTVPPGDAPAGTLYVTGSAIGYSSQTVAVTIGTTGDTASMSLSPQTALAVQVLNSLTNNGVSGLSVAVASASGGTNPGSLTTNSSGIANFSPIAVGTYNVSISGYQVLGYSAIVSQTPANPVTVSSSAATVVTIDLLPEVGTLSGVVTNSANGLAVANATVSVSTGSGTPITATTSSTGAYSITDLTAGTYTATVTGSGYTADTVSGIVISAGITVVQNFALTPTFIHQFVAGLQMFSAPYDYSGQSLASILTGDYDSTNGNAPNVLAVWSALDNSYVKSPTAPADTLHAGQGYWGRFGTSGGLLLSAGAAAPSNTFLLNAGWNMIGDPTTSDINLANLGFYDSRGLGNPNDNNAPYTFAEASSISGINIISPNLYTYDQGTNSYDLVAIGSTDGISAALIPYSGYWIYAYTNCTLVF